MQTGPITSSEPVSAAGVLPLFHAAWPFAIGILIAHWLWLRPSFLLIALAPVAALCGLAALRAPRIAWLPLAALWLLLGTWCALMEPQPTPAPPLAALSDDLLRSVEGTVIDSGPIRAETELNLDEPAAESPSQRVDLRVATVEQVTDAADTQIPITGRVRLTIRWPAANSSPQPFHCGERIRAIVRLLPPETYHDPGVWSRADYLLNQGITATASVAINRVEDLGPSHPASLACLLSQSQHAVTARLLALPTAMRALPAPLRLTPEDAAMLAAMIAGDRTYLTHSLRVGFERTGSFHMLVVSGLHLAIVAGCIFWITRRLRLPRAPATFVTIAASLAYALFTGFATPVQRSLWMVSLYLVARLVYRERSPLNTIGFAALCMLAASPRSLFDASLQMTLLAVVALAGIAAPLLQATIHPYLEATSDLRITGIDAKLTPPLAQFRVTLRMFGVRLQAATSYFIAWRLFPSLVRLSIRALELLITSCVIELAMTLPMAIYFHRITLFALPVNLLILPLLALLLPAALALLLALVLWPAAAAAPAVVVAVLLHCSNLLVRIFALLTLADLRIATPLAAQQTLFLALLAAAIALALHAARQNTYQSLNTAGAAWLAYAACAAMLAAACVAIVPRPIDHPHNSLLVEAIDVGQGDSILLITPSGKTLLVDGGGFGGGPRQAPQEFDIGEEVVSPTLWARGIHHLDAIALTHAHSDHMGGLPAILRNFHPDELWVGNNPPIPAYNALLTQAAKLHVRVRSFHAGDSFSFDEVRNGTQGAIQISVLAPLAGYAPGTEPSNDDSLVLRVANGTTSVLLEGDAEAPVENAMLSQPAIAASLASTLLKVGHHGSVTSTSPGFLARVAPQWAVISCGLHNRYGHPREEILDELEAARVRTRSTDVNGIACFRLDGLHASADPDCSP